MILLVDGHEIQVLTQDDLDDLTVEERERFSKPVRAYTETGHFAVRLPGSETKAVMIDVQGDLGLVQVDYTMVRPPGGDVPMSIASLRPVRVEGREDPRADALHQARLFHAIGSVTVAGGHVEMAMRKVLVSLRGGQNHDLAADDLPAEWNRLNDELNKHCKNGTSELQRKTLALLDDSANAGLRELRNDAIHSYWWLLTNGTGQHFIGARYFHPKAQRPPSNWFPTAEYLQRVAHKLFTFAAQLEALVTPDWPLAIVPALGEYRGGSGDEIKLRERLDDQGTRVSDIRVSQATRPKPGQKPNGRSPRKKTRRHRR